MEKLSIQNEMAQFDKKNRGFYDELTDEERKKFSNYLMIRWGSCVQGSRDLQEFYVISTNERLNKHFFTMGQHPKLQWLCATTVSPDLGAQRHQWIAPKKSGGTSNSAVRKRLAELYPAYGHAELDLLARITTKAELDEHAKQSGN